VSSIDRLWPLWQPAMRLMYYFCVFSLFYWRINIELSWVSRYLGLDFGLILVIWINFGFTVDRGTVDFIIVVLTFEVLVVVKEYCENVVKFWLTLMTFFFKVRNCDATIKKYSDGVLAKRCVLMWCLKMVRITVSGRVFQTCGATEKAWSPVFDLCFGLEMHQPWLSG